jgi:hypothetical protein
MPEYGMLKKHCIFTSGPGRLYRKTGLDIEAAEIFDFKNKIKSSKKID